MPDVQARRAQEAPPIQVVQEGVQRPGTGSGIEGGDEAVHAQALGRAEFSALN